MQEFRFVNEAQGNFSGEFQHARVSFRERGSRNLSICDKKTMCYKTCIVELSLPDIST
jgi:hypothetical protein